MNAASAVQGTLVRWGRSVRASVFAWWHVLLLGAQILVLSLTPSSYQRGSHRVAVLHNLYMATAPLLTWFLVLSALISIVLIRIVVATAYSYGLTQYAIEVLVRTLVLELIPLYAAMFVALRYAMPGAQRVRKQLADHQRLGVEHEQQELMRIELLPRALGSMFSVLMLAALSCVVALVLTYLTLYGFSPWGFPAYTRSVGQVFTPAVSLIFCLKTFFFSLAVAVVPLAGSAQRDAEGRYSRRSDISEFARLFSVLLLIEVVSLLGNYY
ncbi:MAG: ABC transporter permease [Betaproteobacteria bacterium HGW-Betaproteobacteria-16]|nr:MAG: ABC transporter permease [Betaproteobacteria bacterium HGW-Betaproteobacteria-16]